MSLNEDITEMPKSVTSQEATPQVTPTSAQGAIKKDGATKELAAPALDQAPPQSEIAAKPALSRRSRRERIVAETRRKKEEEEKEKRATDALMHEFTLLMTKLSTELPTTAVESAKREILTTLLEEVVEITTNSSSVAGQIACASHSRGLKKRRSAEKKKEASQSPKAGLSHQEAERRILAILVNAESGTTVGRPEPLVQGPPNECDLFTKKDPHFINYIRNNKTKSLDEMLEGAKTLIEFSTAAVVGRRQ